MKPGFLRIFVWRFIKVKWTIPGIEFVGSTGWPINWFIQDERSFILQKWERNETVTFDCLMKSRERWVGTKNLVCSHYIVSAHFQNLQNKRSLMCSECGILQTCYSQWCSQLSTLWPENHPREPPPFPYHGDYSWLRMSSVSSVLFVPY